MPRFAFDPRTCQMVLAKLRKLSALEVLADVKRRRRDLIHAHSITDAELMLVINKVLGGTRNHHYLTDNTNYARMRDVCSYIIREHSY
jgi:hypothetical protein